MGSLDSKTLLGKHLGIVDNPSQSLLLNLEQSNSSNQIEITEDSRQELFDNVNVKLPNDSFFIKDIEDHNLWHVIEKKYVNLSLTRTHTIERISNSKLNIYEYSDWKDEFQKNGIEISRRSTITNMGTKWHIKDESSKDLTLSFRERPELDIEEQFPIPGEQYTYEVRKIMGTESRLQVKRIIELTRNENRSPPLDTLYDNIDEHDAKTARIVAIFLSPKNYRDPISQPPHLSSTIYKINVVHLGDIFEDRKKPTMRVARKMRDDLEGFAGIVDFLDLDEKANQEIDTRVNLIKNSGLENNQFARLGIPLSGTTVIRLKPHGNTAFEGLTLRILYQVWKRVQVQ